MRLGQAKGLYAFARRQAAACQVPVETGDVKVIRLRVCLAGQLGTTCQLITQQCIGPCEVLASRAAQGAPMLPRGTFSLSAQRVFHTQR